MLDLALPIVILASIAIGLHYLIYEPLFLNPKSRIPGPKLYAVSKWRLALDDWRGNRTIAINRLHESYGSVVRIGPNEIHFNSLSALRTIYGAGSGYERTAFYRMFDAYGRQNLFTFHTSKAHGDRKKMLANAYSKSQMLRGPSAEMIEGKVGEYMALLSASQDRPQEIFSSLHYFSIDSITAFLYGEHHGGTSALAGGSGHRALLNDILDPARRRLSWFAVHLPRMTKWLYTRTHLVERLLRPLLPMQKPSTYTGIRAHALSAFYSFKRAALAGEREAFIVPTIITQLWKNHVSEKQGGLEDLDLASECADRVVAGIDTTSDTLMFLIWALSLPENRSIQARLIAEVRSISSSDVNNNGVPTVASTDGLMYLDAIIKETLRLYSPLPASEPRSLPTDSVIDGFAIPAGTVVAMSPFSLHRNAEIFRDPLRFLPERWLGSKEEVLEMNRWFWAFSSGGRMCIGLQ